MIYIICRVAATKKPKKCALLCKKTLAVFILMPGHCPNKNYCKAKQKKKIWRRMAGGGWWGCGGTGKIYLNCFIFGFMATHKRLTYSSWRRPVKNALAIETPTHHT